MSLLSDVRSLGFVCLLLAAVSGGCVSSPQESEPMDAGMMDAGGVDAQEGADAEEMDAESDGEGGACSEGYARPIDGGPMGDELVLEASGLAASRVTPGMLWTHNDSGDGAVLYAMAEDGAAMGRLTLEGVEAKDFEDIAAARCPDGQGECLWVADVGNNALERDDLVIHVVREPDTGGVPFGEISAAPLVSLPVSYPDDAVDCEALVVTPDGKALFMIEKTNDPRPRIFAHPGSLNLPNPVVLTEAGRFDSPGVPIDRGYMVTGADMHPTEPRVVVRLYTGVFEYRLEPGASVVGMDDVDPLLVVAGPLSEPQGEAVTYDDSGEGIWTVSEDREGMPGQVLHFYGCEEE